jgi:hypothetical protein
VSLLTGEIFSSDIGDGGASTGDLSHPQSNNVHRRVVVVYKRVFFIEKL